MNSMGETIIVGILGLSGLLIHVISKAIFLALPVGSSFAWAFAVLSLVGLGLIFLIFPLLRLQALPKH